jgi:4-carboxymuconolactone decarboxylase
MTPDQRRPPSLDITHASSGEVPPERLTAAQADAVEQFITLRGVEPFGPFVDLLVSPELMNRVSALGEYLRFRSALPPRLSELAVLVTAAHWRQLFEWEVHAPIALAAGLSQEKIDAVWAHVPPPHLEADEQVVYAVCTALHVEQKVGPSLRARCHEVLGELATMDTIAICGYYALLAMILNSRPPAPNS